MQEEATNIVEEQIEDGEIVELDSEESDASALETEAQEPSKEDELENYSKGVQKRIANLTKKCESKSEPLNLHLNTLRICKQKTKI
jgi:hypothetical protein